MLFANGQAYAMFFKSKEQLRKQKESEAKNKNY